MARRKQTLTQRSFALMEVREDALELDGEELRAKSVQGALNMRALVTGAMEARPGLVFDGFVGSERAYEVEPVPGVRFMLYVKNTSLELIPEDTGTYANITSGIPWSDADTVWVEPFRKRVVVGSDAGIVLLTYDADATTWSLSDWEFGGAAGGELAQPYWAYEPEITITPSALTGSSITVTASADVFTDDHIGLRIRYHNREMEITARASGTSITCDVVNNLPPSFDVVVTDASEYRVGEIVVGADTDFQGLIVGIASTTLNIVTLEYFEGPDVGEDLAGPAGSAEVSSVTAASSPYGSTIWDEPVMSDVRGYPQAACAAAGRFFLFDFPLVPDLICASSSRDIADFQAGAEDDDAIQRQIGENAPRVRHGVSAADLIFLTDGGCYFLRTRDGTPITPNNFNAIKFDSRGANAVKPVKVDDAVAFVEAGGQTISAAIIDGNIYLNWSVRRLTDFHYQLVNNPVVLCGPPDNSDMPEKYLLVVNGDGTIAAASWIGLFRDAAVGFAPWTTEGNFLDAFSAFNKYYAIVERENDGADVRSLERFDLAAKVDCALFYDESENIQDLLKPHTGSPPDEINLEGHTVHIVDTTDSDYYGTFTVDGTGALQDPPDSLAGLQIGHHFTSKVEPWPAENIDSRRAGMITPRTVRVGVSVQNTDMFKITANNNSRTFSGWSFGDDLSAPLAPKTKKFSMLVQGRRDHPAISFEKHIPGKFRVLAITQEVQV